MTRHAAVIILTVILIIPAVFAARADDSLDTFFPGSEKDGKQWRSSVGTTWLPGSGMDNGNGDVSMSDSRVNLRKSFKAPGEVFFLTGIGYSQQRINAPAASRLPDTLHSVTMMLGAGRKVGEADYMFVMAAPGVRSDFKSGANTTGLRMPISFIWRHRYSAGFVFAAGLAYRTGFSRYPVLPVGGLIYRPSERWTFEFGFPRTGVSYKIDKARLYARALFSGGEYRTDAATVGARRLRYSDRRLATGISYRLSPELMCDINAGYAFKRRFTFPDNDRADIAIKDAPFAGGSVSYSW